MGVTTQKSTQVTALDAGGLANWQSATKLHQSVRLLPFEFTQSGAGDQNSTADLVKLPPGKFRVALGNSWIDYPATTNGALQVGHTGYTGNDGVAVAASATAFLGSTTITSAGRTTLLAAAFFDYDSPTEITVQAKFTGTGGVAGSAVFKGVIALMEP